MMDSQTEALIKELESLKKIDKLNESSLPLYAEEEKKRKYYAREEDEELKKMYEEENKRFENL